MPQHLHLFRFPSGAVSIDLYKHLEELPLPVLLPVPSCFTHSIIADALILRWYDVHGPDRSWELAIQLGGQRAGYTDGWVLHRYLHILDAMDTQDADDAIVSPPFLAPVIDPQIETSPESGKDDGVESELCSTPPPSCSDAHRSKTPTKRHKFNRRNWNADEDARLRAWIDENKDGSWRSLSRHMGGRSAGFSDDSVRNRWLRLTGKIPSKYLMRKGLPPSTTRWSGAEDEIILETCAFMARNQYMSWTKLVAELTCRGYTRTKQATRLRAQRLGIVQYAPAA